MTECHSIQTGLITGIGVAKGQTKAIKKAVRDVKKQGRTACMPGGDCPFGTSCNYRIDSLDIQVEYKVVDDGGPMVYEATASSSGHCTCA